MKKFISLFLVITSLFTLSSSISCCAVEENPKTAEVEATIDVNTTNEKEDKIKKLKINKFLAENRKWFPENKIDIIKERLNELGDDDLEIVLKLDFKNPKYVTLSAFFGLDELILNNIFKFFPKAALSFFASCGLFKLFKKDHSTIDWSGFYLLIIWNALCMLNAPWATQDYNYNLLCRTLGE